jgi:hypothetical protein
LPETRRSASTFAAWRKIYVKIHKEKKDKYMKAFMKDPSRKFMAEER